MDLEESRDPPTLCQDPTPAWPWDPPPGGPSGLSHMDLDGTHIQELVQQFEALPGDLVGLACDASPCPLHIATGRGLAPPDTAGAPGLLSTEAGREDLLSLLHGEKQPPAQPDREEPPDAAPRLLQPPEDLDQDQDPPEWEEGASAERRSSSSSSSSPEAWLETSPLVTPEEPPSGAQQSLAPVTTRTSWMASCSRPSTWAPRSWFRSGTHRPAHEWPRLRRPWTASRHLMGSRSP